MAEIQSNIRINVDTTSAVSSLKSLQGQISAFQTQMAKSGAASAAAARGMQQNLLNNLNASGKFAATMTTVRSETESFTHALERNKMSMGEYFRYAGAATKTFGKLFGKEFDTINKVAESRVRSLQSQYIKLGRDASGAMQAIKVRPLALDMENLGTKTQVAAQRQQLLNQLLHQGSTAMLNWGKNTQWAGRQLMVGFTIPLLMFSQTAEKAYKDMEMASVSLRRVYGDLNTTEAETNAMAKSVENLAHQFTQYGIAVSDTMNIAAKIAATGKQGQDLLTQVNEVSRMAALGGVTQEQSLETVISLTNAFGVSSKDLADNINFLNFTQNQTVLSLSDMTEAIPKAAPVVQQLGGNVKDLAFFLTAMREGGISASQGANALKSGLASIINPSKQASDFLKSFNINLSGIVTSNKGNIKQTVIDLANALNKLDPLNRAQAIEKLFGKFQFSRMSALLKNVTDANSQASQVSKIAEKSKAELEILAERELKRVSDSPLYKFQKAQKEFQAALIPLGEQFMKSMMPIIDFFTNFIKGFNDLNKKSGGFLSNIVTWVAGIGPVVLMGIGLIANAVANVIKLFAGLKSFMNRSQSKSSVLGETTHYMTQEQIDAAAATSSLEQAHNRLTQAFTVERENLGLLINEYETAIAAQGRLMGASNSAAARAVVPIAPAVPMNRMPIPPMIPSVFSGAPGLSAIMKSRNRLPGYATGVVRGPGTGTSDSIPAMISNGEAVIPAKSVAKYPGLVNGLIAGNIPGFEGGVSLYGGQSRTLPGLAAYLPGNNARGFGFSKELLTGSNNSLLIARLTEAAAAGGYVLDKRSGISGLSRITETLTADYTRAVQQYIPGIVNALKTTEASMSSAGKDVSNIDLIVTEAAPELKAIFEEMTLAGGKAASAAQALSQHMFFADEAAMSSMGEHRYPGARWSNTKNRVMATDYRATRGAFQRAVQGFAGSVGPSLGAGETYAHFTSTSGKGPIYPYAGGAVRSTDLVQQREIVNALAKRAGVDAEFIMAQIGEQVVLGSQKGLTQATKNAFGIASPSREEIYIAEQRREGFKVGMQAAIKEEEVLAKQSGKFTGAAFFTAAQEAAAKPIIAPKKQMPTFFGAGNLALTAANISRSEGPYVPPTQSRMAQARANLAREGVWLKAEWQEIMNPIKASLSAAKAQVSEDAMVMKLNVQKAFNTLIPESSAMGQAWSQLKANMVVARGNFLTEWEWIKDDFFRNGKALEVESSAMGKNFANLARMMGITNRIAVDQASKGNLNALLTKKVVGITQGFSQYLQPQVAQQKTIWQTLISSMKTAGNSIKEFANNTSQSINGMVAKITPIVKKSMYGIETTAISLGSTAGVAMKRGMSSASGMLQSAAQKIWFRLNPKAEIAMLTKRIALAEDTLQATRAHAAANAEMLTAAEIEEAAATEKAILREQELAQQRINQLQGKRGMGGMGAGMALSMIPMMMSMNGDKKVAEIGNQLMMPAMIASSALMMFPGPVGIAIAAITALITGFTMLNDSIKKANIATIKTGQSMAIAGDGVTAMSKATRTVAVSDAARRSEADARSIANKKEASFGESFIRTMQPGKALSSYMQGMQIRGNSSTNMAQDMVSKLGYQIAQGTLTVDQAKSIAMAIGNKLKDQRFSANVVAKIESMFGPNGENLTKDPLKITAALTVDNESINRYNARFEDSLTNDIGFAKVVHNMNVANYQTEQGSLDIINAQYDAKVAAAKTQKEINDLEAERTKALQDQMVLNEKMFQNMVKQRDQLIARGESYDTGIFQTTMQEKGSYKKADQSSKDAMDKLFNNIINFTQDYQSAQPSLKPGQDVSKSNVSLLKTRLEFELMSGQSWLDVKDVYDLVKKFAGKDQESISKSINLSFQTLGSAKTLDIINTAQTSKMAKDQIQKILDSAVADADLGKARISALHWITELQGSLDAKDIKVKITATLVDEVTSNISALTEGSKATIKITPEVVDAAYGKDSDQAKIIKTWLGTDQAKSMTKQQQIRYIATYTAEVGKITESDPGYKTWAANPKLNKGYDLNTMGYISYLSTLAAETSSETGAGGSTGGSTGGNTGGNTGGASPSDLLKTTKEAKDASVFAALTANNGWGKDLSDALNSADKNTRDYYTDLNSKGIPILNAHGKELKKAFDAKVISDAKKAMADFNASLTQKTKDVNSQIQLQNSLRAKGVSQADAAAAAANSEYLTQFKNAKNAVDRAAILKTIIGLMKEEKRLAEAMKSEEQKKLDAAEKALNLKNAELEKATAEQHMAEKQAQMNTYSDALNVLSIQEDAINKTYDERITALDKIQQAHQAIAEAQKDQLTIADAITKGDIAAAAKAAQDARANAANRAMDEQKNSMEIAKQNQLDALTVKVNGKLLTRKQIEAENAKIQAEIYSIQLNILDPLNQQIGKLTDIKNLADAAKTIADLNAPDISNVPDPKADPTKKQLLANAKTLAPALYNQIMADAKKVSAAKTAAGKAAPRADANKAYALLAALASSGNLGTFSNGGKIMSYFSNGGDSRGTDIVPAMLTPGEFIMSRGAVEQYGLGVMDSINSGSFRTPSYSLDAPVSSMAPSVSAVTSVDNSSVYNNTYHLNVSTNASDANAVAQVVMQKIRNIEAQNVRGIRR